MAEKCGLCFITYKKIWWNEKNSVTLQSHNVSKTSLRWSFLIKQIIQTTIAILTKIFKS